ncbi:MAG: serine protease [Thioalkalivibrio sp.]|nr:serine protease [Thioalkalivibrio sp.]
MVEAEEGSADQLSAMRAWNESGTKPPRNGFSRPLANPIRISSRESSAKAGTLPAFKLSVDGAAGLRLHARVSDLPSNTGMWVWADGQAPIFFDESLVVSGELWTPTVWADHIYFELRAGSSADLTFSQVMQLFEPAAVGSDDTSCFVDARCITNTDLDVADSYRKSIASYEFVRGGQGYVCSGGLIIDEATTFKPYFLTAAHCVSSQAEAATVNAYWDYTSSTCSGMAPSKASLPRSVGATLLVASHSTDVALLQLTAIPGGRFFMGFDTRESSVSNDTLLYRFSHPEGRHQAFSLTRVATNVSTCSESPRPRFIYSTPLVGGATNGSSGSPVIIEGGYIVGQLEAGCGPDPSNGCDPNIKFTDGALSRSISVLAPFLYNAPTTCSPCVSNSTTACLLGNRFKVTLPSWYDPFAKISGQGTVLRYAENREEVHPQYGPLGATSFFSLYAHAPSSIEVTLRMFKGVAINDHYWVFMSGFTGADYTIRVEDTQTCKVWQRSVPSGATNVVKDYEAFPFP